MQEDSAIYDLTEMYWYSDSICIKRYDSNDYSSNYYTLSGIGNTVYKLDHLQIIRHQELIDSELYIDAFKSNFKFDVLKTVLKIYRKYQRNTSDYAMQYLHNQLYKLNCDYNATVTIHACLFILLNNFNGHSDIYKDIVDFNTNDPIVDNVTNTF